MLICVYLYSLGFYIRSCPTNIYFKLLLVWLTCFLFLCLFTTCYHCFFCHCLNASLFGILSIFFLQYPYSLYVRISLHWLIGFLSQSKSSSIFPMNPHLHPHPIENVRSTIWDKKISIVYLCSLSLSQIISPRLPQSLW